MIERYSLPEMKAIWEEENKLRQWLRVEVLAAQAMARLGVIPEEAAVEISEKADFDLERVKEIESVTNHDVIAFVTNVAEKVGPAGKYLHYGLTSSDVLDTATSVQMVQALDLLLEDLEGLLAAIKEKAMEHRQTVMIGRTHGIHAEPITFGLKMALWYEEHRRSLRRLREAREMVAVGKISGAVGTYANVDPFVEEYVCENLGLEPARISTQILQRDRHAHYLMALALVGAVIEKQSTEIRLLQKTETREVEEPFRKGQKGSSAMPHKRNPITCERLSGMARILRGNAMAALENVALWHERDISHSSVERVILPDSTILLDYMIKTFTRVVHDLNVYPEKMAKNLEETGGLVFSQRVLLALVGKGLPREEAYRIVQDLAMKGWSGGRTFKELLRSDPEVLSHLSPEELDDCFDPAYHLKRVDEIFSRVFSNESLGG